MPVAAQGAIVFIVTGQDLAAYRAFFEDVDRPKDLVERVGVGRDERAPACELGQAVEELEIGPLDLRQRPAP